MVITHDERLEVLDQAALQVAGAARLDGGVDEALAPGHAVKVELGRAHALRLGLGLGLGLG